MTNQELRAENEQLRNEVQDYRQREKAALLAALADAEYRAAEYKKQAVQQAEIGRQIYAEQQEIITRLRAQLDASKRLEDGRQQLGFNRLQPKSN